MERKQFYLYCNSGATSVTGALGWIIGPFGEFKTKKAVVKHTGRICKQCYTTTEYAFALEFSSLEDASAFKKKHDLPCIVMQRVD